jgi:UDP-glucuronate 4-epimerase
MAPSIQDNFPSTPGKVKMERSNYFGRVTNRWHTTGSAKLFLFSVFLLAITIFICFRVTANGMVDGYISSTYHSTNGGTIRPAFKSDHAWDTKVTQSCTPERENGLVVLVTGAAGFVGSHISLALKKRGDGLVGLDNFNDYYEVSLKRARQELLLKQGIFVIEDDINDAALLKHLFDMVQFTHVMHLAAQAGVRYAMQNPMSYIHSNIAGLVTLFEACKSANPQPAVVWASSSSVYGLNSKVPFSESDRTDQPASLYAATKKAGEELAHTYNHIYGLSITGLRFFTVYGPWGRPDMAYFSFTRDILKGKPINIYKGQNDRDLARDFTFIDDIVKGCVASLDTSGRSTGSGGKKRGAATFRTFNLGNTSPVTVPVLVEILEKHLKVEAKKEFIKMPRNGDVPFTHANVSLAQTQLGYKPTTNLEIGLKKFVNWYVKYYGVQTTKTRRL